MEFHRILKEKRSKFISRRFSRKLKYPKCVVFFDILTLIGLIIIISKLVIFVTVKVTGNGIDFLSDSILYSFGPLLLMIIGVIGSDTLKKKYQ